MTPPSSVTPQPPKTARKFTGRAESPPRAYEIEETAGVLRLRLARRANLPRLIGRFLLVLAVSAGLSLGGWALHRPGITWVGLAGFTALYGMLAAWFLSGKGKGRVPTWLLPLFVAALFPATIFWFCARQWTAARKARVYTFDRERDSLARDRCVVSRLSEIRSIHVFERRIHAASLFDVELALIHGRRVLITCRSAPETAVLAERIGAYLHMPVVKESQTDPPQGVRYL